MAFNHNCNKTTCDHQAASGEDPAEWSLFSKIDVQNLQCLNELVDGSCKKIFRSWDDRLNRDYVVKSDVDQELLFNIPFNGSVKLKGIVIIGPNDTSHPVKMKLYKNKPFMTFDDVASECEQEIELIQDPDGLIVYPLKIVKFSSVSHLSIFIPKNFGSSETPTLVNFIGLKGEFTQAMRQQVVITNYESQANPADHKVDFLKTEMHDIL